jgi:tetratricopeptide (TPR) repeat protein
MGSLNEKIIAERSKARRSMAERVRRGACLLNAAQYDEAIAELGMAVDVAPDADPLRSNVASCFNHQAGVGSGSRSIDSLRESIAADSENPDLHFRLGVLLAEGGLFEEAELRFTQVLSISRDHVEALVSLALCHQRRLEAGKAIPYLQRAQALRPGDATIGLFLAQAAKMSHERGEAIDLCAVIANDNSALGRIS